MTIIYSVLVAIHVAACLFLIAVILLQAGRGGGLVESFNMSDSIFGTKTSSFLQKATAACAIIFIFTCLALAFITAQKSKSIMRQSPVLDKMVPLPEDAPAAEQKPKSDSTKKQQAQEGEVKVDSQKENKESATQAVE